MAPPDLVTSLGSVGANLVQFLLGFGFGFALERAGFGDSRKLAAQFYLRDMTVLKVMFTAIITAMVLLFWGVSLGWVDYGRIFVNPTYLWPAIAGGFILGFGFIIGGFCPGTALVSMATLKVDGLFFVAGVFLGVFVFGETVPMFWDFFQNGGFQGRFTLSDWLGWSLGGAVFAAVVMALAFFWGAERVEAVFRRPGSGEAR